METRLESQIDWGWKVAADLFLAGTGAGAYAFGVVALLLGGAWLAVAKMGVLLAFPLVLAGALFLLADLGIKGRAMRAFLNPGTSWITRGTIILTIFMILNLIQIGAWIWPSKALEASRGSLLTLSFINFFFAVMVMVYTGVLLGASKPMPFWCSATLPLLFLVSALATGLLVSALALIIYDLASAISLKEQISTIVRAATILLILKALIILFHLQATHSRAASRASTSMLLRGWLCYQFWLGVVGIGLLLPIILGVAAPTGLGAVLIVSLSGLFGGLMLRYVVIAAGVKEPLRAAGIEFAMPVMR